MRTKKSALIFAFIAVFWLSTMQVYAQDNRYAIHIEFAANNKTKPIEGVGFKAVRFMDINYHALDGWKEKDVSYEKIFDDPQSSALELKEIEEKQSSETDVLTGMTDKNGKLAFQNLPSGYYLIYQTDQNGGGAEYQLSPPAIVGIPFMEDGEEKSDVIIYPKTVPIEKPDNSTPKKTVNQKDSGNGVRTGDTANYDIYAVMFLSSAIILFIIGNRRRKYYEE